MPSGSRSTEAGEAARGATLYVTLEPCSHFGASPPCVDAIIAAGVARVVSAMEDPNPLVGGQGHARLRAAGIAVSVGAGAAQARRDHLGHILRVTAGRPCVTLKLAETADGFASAGANDARLRITGPIADLRVQIMRSTHEAIMVGVGTALGRRSGLDRAADRPRSQAAARGPRHPSAPARRLASRRDGQGCSDAGHRGATAPDEAARRLEDLGVTIERAPLDAEGHVDLHHALRALSVARDHPGVQRRRAAVAARLIALQLADEVALITADKPLGRPGVPALDPEARSALLDGSHYCAAETLDYGPDTCGSGGGRTSP